MWLGLNGSVLKRGNREGVLLQGGKKQLLPTGTLKKLDSSKYSLGSLITLVLGVYEKAMKG